MTVKEVRALEPKADVYELSPGCKYLVLFSRKSISMATLDGIQKFFLKEKIHAVFVYPYTDEANAVRIYDVTAEPSASAPASSASEPTLVDP